MYIFVNPNSILATPKHCVAELFIFIQLKLELLTQFLALND